MSDSIIKEWPVLQSTAKTGKTKYWQIRALNDGGNQWGALVEVEWWQEGSVHQRQARKVQGKNIGRANETTPIQQALSEAESDFKKQQDKGYSEDGNKKVDYLLPMLAQDYKSKSKKIVFPCAGQPKLDGVRCLFNNRLGFWSRQGKPFDAVDLNHLRWEELDIYTCDGELILPQPYTFQQTVSAIKKQNELTPLLEYHVFDFVIVGPFHSRWNMWQKLENNKPERVKKVPTAPLLDQSDVEDCLQKFLLEGYEGLILRNLDGEYEVAQRSNDLQKYKEFIDDEYEVVDVVDGVGKEEGAAVFVCKTKEGNVFKTRPRGDYNTRRQQYSNRQDFIGKYLTVRYQNLTDDGIPRFPVALAIRDMVDGKPEL